MTSGQIFSRPARPDSVNKHFILHSRSHKGCSFVENRNLFLPFFSIVLLFCSIDIQYNFAFIFFFFHQQD